MRDILMDVYNVLKQDKYVNSVVDVNSHVTFNRYPELESIQDTWIVIDDIDDTLPFEYADDDNLALSYLIQVDVYTKVKDGINARTLRNELSYRISRLLKDELGMINTANAKPEYDEEFKLYRSARRYELTDYRNELI